MVMVKVSVALTFGSASVTPRNGATAPLAMEIRPDVVPLIKGGLKSG